eukprot:Hpha_TRINITY_DN34845_c0_g1::TRINITY_DN34845_c0_g1_i1::g.167745::m.167745
MRHGPLLNVALLASCVAASPTTTRTPAMDTEPPQTTTRSQSMGILVERTGSETVLAGLQSSESKTKLLGDNTATGTRVLLRERTETVTATEKVLFQTVSETTGRASETAGVAFQSPSQTPTAEPAQRGSRSVTIPIVTPDGLDPLTLTSTYALQSSRSVTPPLPLATRTRGDASLPTPTSTLSGSVGFTRETPTPRG